MAIKEKTMDKKYNKIYIVASPIFYSKDYKTSGERRVTVPGAFFKVVLRIERHREQQKISVLSMQTNLVTTI